MKKLLAIAAAAALLLTGCARTYLSREKCEDLAFADAGVLRDDVSALHTETDDGECEVEFTAGGWEYEYTVDRKNGNILTSGKEQLPAQPATQHHPDEHTTQPETPTEQTPATEPADGQLLTEDEVRELVAERLPDVDLSRMRLELDWDDGRRVYEGEVRDGRVEYDFELDAETGEFLKWEEDRE